MRRILFFVIIFAVFAANTSFIINSSGIAGRSGSPGETTCSACHGGGGGTTSVLISATPAFVASQFIPGQTYTVDVTVTNNLFTKFGFDAEILDPSNVNAGNITAGLTGVQIINNTRRNVVHTAPKTGAGSATFRFVWVAPMSGTATIFAAGNAADGSGGAGLDTPGDASLVLTANFSEVNEIALSGISGLNIFPNPVKTDFKISYSLTESGDINISLYNVQGKYITEITSEKQNAGNHLLEVSIPPDLTKGVYFVRLSVKGKQEIQRIIITQ